MSVVNFFISAGKAFAEWRRREHAYAELMALDDHSLADIGIRRSQIGALIDGVRMADPPLPPTSFGKQERFARRKAA
jgi:uncharacterized protein YjiS (DUF1127 family)